MAAKRIAFEQEARDAIRKGVQQLARAVKVTLGPRGRNVMIERGFGAPLVTKDGVTVAKEIELPAPWENMGSQMVREVASKTSDTAGDGTTTATVLAEAIFERGLQALRGGVKPVQLKRGIEKAVQQAVRALRELSKEVEGSAQIAHVGAIAANNDPAIGQVLADALARVGKDGVITVDEGQTLETTTEFVDGMSFDRGYLSPYFVTDADTMSVHMEDALILLVDGKVSSVVDLVPVLEAVLRAQKPLLIVAEDVEGEALALLVVNRIRGALQVCAVKAPAFGDRRKAMLEDMAVLTGGRVVSRDIGLSLDKIGIDDLGRARRVTVKKDETTLVEGGGQPQDVKARLAQIRAELEATTSGYDREKLEERIAKLSGGVARVLVGASTEVEMKEKKARVEDALHATRAAIEEGIVPGGGMALLRAARSLDALDAHDEEAVGVQIVRRALEAPLRQIARNSGVSASVVIDHVLEREGNYGFNALTLEYGDLVAQGVIDPTKVARTALENAASVATLLLTTEALVGDVPKPARKGAAVGGGDMGGDEEDYDDFD